MFALNGTGVTHSAELMDSETIEMLSGEQKGVVSPRTPLEAYPDMDRYSGELQWANSSCLPQQPKTEDQ